jgi:Arc/MetJ-type ribon-helix-helix transcriptional regulator
MTWKRRAPGSASTRKSSKNPIPKRPTSFSLSEHAIELLDRIVMKEQYSNRTVVLEIAIREKADKCDQRINLRNLLEEREKKRNQNEREEDERLRA